MKWRISYSAEAKQDLRDIYEYIAFELFAPDTAAAQYRRIIQSVNKLEDMPMRFPLYRENPWKDLGMRWFPVDNYLVFFLNNEIGREVCIVRIMYKGRDVSRQLEDE